MNLKGYLETINKCNCPKNCEVKKKRDIEIALLPPPNKIVGVLISRDPTIRWWDFYRAMKNVHSENVCRKMLFASAIPLSLIKRIVDFTADHMTDQIDSNTIGSLIRVMFENVYWTHLHKCFTDINKLNSVAWIST